MLDRALIRKEPETVRAGALRKGVNAPVDEFLAVDEKWRDAKHQLDVKNGEMNQVSKSIGALIGQGKKDEAEAAKRQTGELKAEIQRLEQLERDREAQLHEIELQFPNLPHPSVPDGDSPEQNTVVREWGDKPFFAEPPKSHIEICQELGLVDFEKGSKVSGSGFVVYTDRGSKLVRALYSWMLDYQTQNNGYTEMYPPFLVSSESLVGTGNLPKFAEDLYKTTDDLWLVPTAEVPVTNLYRDEIVDGTDLPIKLAAYTACFRREAGAAGRETRGLLRMHQFDKVELVKFVLPERSYEELETLTLDAEGVLQALGLHYRVLLLCAGDMGDKGCKCYDLEVWSPGENKYLEVSSCTNFEAYQSRRANVRFRRGPGEKPEFVHILNGSGLAVPRLFVALIESNRISNGDVVLPEPLWPYMGMEILRKDA
jgi:seryl-tRNA synthetase